MTDEEQEAERNHQEAERVGRLRSLIAEGKTRAERAERECARLRAALAEAEADRDAVWAALPDGARDRCSSPRSAVAPEIERLVREQREWTADTNRALGAVIEERDDANARAEAAERERDDAVAERTRQVLLNGVEIARSQRERERAEAAEAQVAVIREAAQAVLAARAARGSPTYATCRHGFMGDACIECPLDALRAILADPSRAVERVRAAIEVAEAARGCGDSGCAFLTPTERLGGMRTNGGCDCLRMLRRPRARYEAAVEKERGT